MSEPRWAIGSVVALKADPRRSGPIIEVEIHPGGESRYVVFHSTGQTGTYFESQLDPVAVPRHQDRLRDALQGEWLSATEFRSRLTAARLANPGTETLYALQSARIQFVPFQFKPLLRFVRSEQPRLLIADEVGVGKTIEAGLILREMQSRQEVNNVMVICPKALVHKWRAEMLRFDEDFRPLSSETLRYCLKEAHLDGAWPSQFQRCIVHLELLRMEDHLEALTKLDPAPRFDLAIIDEAHHVRTPGTLSHELARYICDVSEGVLFLSATPMQVASANLHSLLNLLRPDQFPIEAIFNEVMAPNESVIEAGRHIRSRRPETWQQEAATKLRDAAATAWGHTTLRLDPVWQRWVERLESSKPLTDEERIRGLRDIEELHSLAHIMNRTRRRDIGAFTIREPVTVSVNFTPEQRNFYDQLLAFRREMLSLQHDPRVVSLIIDTLERQATSCLPAMAELLDVFLLHGRLNGVDVTDVPEFDMESIAIPAGMQTRIEALRAAAHQVKGDPKLEALVEIVEQISSDEGPGKLLVFSYFIHTLDYLKRNLTGGPRVARITGNTPDEDRELLRDRFRLPRSHPDAIDVLLSSEVGCEGLDYEFCDRLVNYDIPWNPMKIEQRIGRIDRFGQRSPKVMIYNFVTPDTVEERIFFRCFDRLDLFRQTVGDMEEILGGLVDELTKAALNPSLTPAQAEEIALQLGDNALRDKEERRRLEEESEKLIGLDEVFVSDINEAMDQGRVVPPGAVRELVDYFLRTALESGLLPDAHRGVDRLRLDKERRALLRDLIRAEKRADRQTQIFVRWLESSDPQLRLTFQQAVAAEERALPFVTAIHPLARAAVRHLSTTDLLTTHLRATATDPDHAPGTYAFICEAWETIGIRPQTTLECTAWNLEREQLDANVSVALLRYLAGGEDAKPKPAPDLTSALIELERAIHETWQQRLAQVRSENERLLEQRRTILSSYHTSRRQRLDSELARLVEPKIIRMKEAERTRVKAEYATKLAELERLKDADVVTRRLAAGLLVLEPM